MILVYTIDIDIASSISTHTEQLRSLKRLKLHSDVSMDPTESYTYFPATAATKVDISLAVGQWEITSKGNYVGGKWK